MKSHGNACGDVDVEMGVEVKDVIEQARTLVETIGSELEGQLRAMMKEIDIAEVFSPSRVTVEAERRKMNPGIAMDLRTVWDFSPVRHQQAALKYVDLVKPRLLIGSPECRMFSTLQN